MSNILPYYEINEQTMVLIPVKHTDYKTIAIEKDQKLHIKKTPFEIIERSCLDNFSSFEGRRESVIHLTGFKRKVPIPISIYRNISVFPTHAFMDLRCSWIFYHHVEFIVEKKLNYLLSMIMFRNGTVVTVEAPRNELLKQLEKTSLLLSLIKKRS